jgi:uncharacterized repeat protein (TIGR03803 family)
LALWLLGIGPVGAQSLGWAPQATMALGNDGNLYGTTYSSVNGWGTIFKMSPSGRLITLHNFGLGGGRHALALTKGKDGNFYGTTLEWGVHNQGTVFKMTPGGQLTTLYTFSAAGDPNTPVAPLTLGQDGNLYGTTEGGGAYGKGTVFQITPSGALTILYSFNTSPYYSIPNGLAVGQDGNLYGTTNHGGTSGRGTVFQITPGGAFTSLYSFSGSDGSNPDSALALGKDGNFYGTTGGGGANNKGTIFRITPSGSLTTLYSFTGGSDGKSPVAGLTMGWDGNFYGATTAGGPYQGGTLFWITTSGILTTLFSFTEGLDGWAPSLGLTQGTDGSFYGTALTSFNGFGTVYKISPGGELHLLHTFNGNDGATPVTTLTMGKDGNFYGTTSGGGASSNGTIFRITPGGVFTSLYSFRGGNDGANPNALALDREGYLYGTCANGGAYSDGTIFKITPSGVFTLLYTFSAQNPDYTNADGANPSCTLVQGTDGDFYGGTSGYGGAYGWGTMFQITPSGTFTTLYSFTGGDDGASPVTSLILGKDGNFYGTAWPANTGNGSIFQMTPSGVLTTLYSFGGTSDGGYPMSLTQDKDGNFYGNAQSGGAWYNGTIFQMTPSGALTTLYSFGGILDGAMGWNAVTLGKDGNIYGSCQQGGANQGGTLFQITPAGAFTTLWMF